MQLLIFLLFFGSDPGIADHYRAHIRFLASDVLKGRETTFEGQKIAAEYIASQLALSGVAPAFPQTATPYFQSFELDVTVLTEETAYFQLRGNGPRENMILDRDVFVRPIGNGKIEARAALAFAGYGLETDYYNDYRDIDAKGKWILVMEGKPKGNGPDSPFRQDSVNGSIFLKYRRALMAGGLGLIILKKGSPREETGGSAAPHSMDFPGITEEGSNLFPIVKVYEETWPTLFGREHSRFEKAVAAIDQEERPHSFVLKRRTLEANLEITVKRKTAENVVGILPGQDPELGREYLVVSAHYDHIGVIEGRVYNGADDNGSGTATLLLLAEHLKNLPRKRGLMLLFVSGEEQGLLGSEFFTKHPAVDLEKIVADINMDMIGRNQPNQIGVIPSQIEGISTLNEILARVNQRPEHGLELLTNLDQYHSRSDHYNFVEKKIPALFFFADVHEDYHSPLDDWDRLDFDKLSRVYGLIEDFVVETLNEPERPVFIKKEDIPESQPESPHGD